MCYPKPGPRCSAHAEAALKKASIAFQTASASGDETAAFAARESLTKASDDFYMTPKGQDYLRTKIEDTGDPSGELSVKLEYGISARAEAIRLAKTVDVGDKDNHEPVDHEALRQARREAQAQRDREIEAEFNAKAIADFSLSWKVRKEPDGVTTVSVYRSGVPSAPSQRGVEAKSYQQCDEQLPDARQGRMSGVFCSPTLGGAARWLRGNSNFTRIPDIEVREIRIDIDRTYVYSVDDWEAASAHETPEMYRKYWENGMTMREYMEAARQNPHKYDPREYELLVAEDSIRSVAPVSSKKIISAAYDNQGELATICKQIKLGKKFASMR